MLVCPGDAKIVGVCIFYLLLDHSLSYLALGKQTDDGMLLLILLLAGRKIMGCQFCGRHLSFPICGIIVTFSSFLPLRKYFSRNIVLMFVIAITHFFQNYFITLGHLSELWTFSNFAIRFAHLTLSGFLQRFLLFPPDFCFYIDRVVPVIIVVFI